MKRPNSRTSTAGERDRPKRPDTVTCTEVLNLPRENYCSLSAGNRTLGGSPRRGRPTVHLSSNEGGGLIPGVRDPVYSPQSCEGVLFCTGAGQETPREPQTLFVHLSSHEEGLNRSGPEPAPLFTSARMRGAVYSGVQKSFLFTSVL